MNSNIIIIGAPRSGTNLLRDLLTSYDDVATWPCDEINFIWRYCNAGFSTDELPDSLVTPKISSYIQGQFQKISRKYEVRHVVEKTCANSLRVPYVNKIFPDAKFLFIVRDGLDAISSICARWHSPIDVSYILKKARYVPLSDWPVYFSRFGQARIDHLLSSRQRLGSWGPVVTGMPEMLHKMSIEQVAAYQWKECVERASECFDQLDEDRVCRITYEDLVSDPQAILRRILRFVGYDHNTELSPDAVASVSVKSIGKGRLRLSKDNLLSVMPIVSDTLVQQGYEPL